MRQRRRLAADRLGRRADRARPQRAARASARSCSRRRRCRTRRCCLLSRSSCSDTGGTGAFRVRAGRGGAARRASRIWRSARERAANVARRRAARLHAQRHAARGARRRRRARSSPTPSWPASTRRGVGAGRRGHRDRHDAAGVGSRNARASCCRSRTWPRRTAPSRTCAAACSASCRRRRRPGMARPSWCVLADLLGALGERPTLLRRRPRRSRALAASAAGVRRA